MTFFQRAQSAAIPIIAPPAIPASPSHPASTPASPVPFAQRAAVKKDSGLKHCRNILIYGSCKYEGKGCTYYHPPAAGDVPSPPTSPSPPITAPTPLVASAPVFIPKLGTDGSPVFASLAPAINVSRSQTHSVQSIVPEPVSQTPQVNEVHDTHENNGYEQYDDVHDSNDMAGSYYDTGHGLDYRGQPLEYHLYTQTLPARMATDATRPHISGYFMSDVTRDMLLRRAQLSRAAPPPGTFGNLPEEVSGYHSLAPLESLGPDRRPTFSQYRGSIYRAVKVADGLNYALRRVEGYRLPHESAFSALEPWTRIRHPNIVGVREGFTTRAFNDESLVIVYDFHGDSQTLFEKYMRATLNAHGHHNHHRQNNRRGNATNLQLDAFIPESTLWGVIVQVAMAIRHVHERGLAVRTVDVNKVIVSGKNRVLLCLFCDSPLFGTDGRWILIDTCSVRIGTCGVTDMLTYGAPHNVQILQEEDMLAFGRLVVQLASNNINGMNNVQKSLETINRVYSPDVSKAAIFLLHRAMGKTIGIFLDSISQHVAAELEGAYDSVDGLESDLSAELENGRLVRLLSKLGFINERPAFDYDPRWSDTGERYTIKLFRDYVFHQQDERGRPVLNLAHVVTCLNKLDAGSDERILLVGREEQNCLVVSFKEVKQCIESAFGELSRAR